MLLHLAFGSAFPKACTVMVSGMVMIDGGESLAPDAGAAQRQILTRRTRAESHLAGLVRRWQGVIFTQRPVFRFVSVSKQLEVN